MIDKLKQVKFMMFKADKKLDEIITLLSDISKKMDRSIYFEQERSRTADRNHLLWLNNQIKFYEKQNDENLIKNLGCLPKDDI